MIAGHETTFFGYLWNGKCAVEASDNTRGMIEKARTARTCTEFMTLKANNVKGAITREVFTPAGALFGMY